jgi:sugar-specific transcriptional regulator TrmB
MSKERITKTLRELGLSNTDTQVYVFLAKNGPHELKDVALALDLYEIKVHTSLRNLQTQKIVRASIKNPLEFIAIPFEEIIDLFIEIKKEKAKAMQESKKELLSSWRKITKDRPERS